MTWWVFSAETAFSQGFFLSKLQFNKRFYIYIWGISSSILDPPSPLSPTILSVVLKLLLSSINSFPSSCCPLRYPSTSSWGRGVAALLSSQPFGLKLVMLLSRGTSSLLLKLRLLSLVASWCWCPAWTRCKSSFLLPGQGSLFSPLHLLFFSEQR